MSFSFNYNCIPYTGQEYPTISERPNISKIRRQGRNKRNKLGRK